MVRDIIYRALGIRPKAFVRNQGSPPGSFVSDTHLHCLGSPSIQLLLAFSQLAVGCQGGFGDQCFMVMQHSIAFQSAYILVRLATFHRARFCSTLAFYSLVDWHPLFYLSGSLWDLSVWCTGHRILYSPVAYLVSLQTTAIQEVNVVPQRCQTLFKPCACRHDLNQSEY